MTLRGKNYKLYRKLIPILNEESPMTLRQLFYRAVSAGLIKNSHAEYQRIGRILTWAREEELVPFSMIVDHVRATMKPPSWSGLASFGESVKSSYRKQFWPSMPHYVDVFVEKDAVAGTIHPVTEEYDVPLRPCRGYSSVSFAGEVADQWKRIKKPIFAYYLGDFDPSGFDIERDLREKLARYSGLQDVVAEGGDDSDADEDNFVWQRLGVNDADFYAHDLIELPVKHKDKRAAGFLSEHGSRCAEIDALPPSELRKRVKQAIELHIDQDKWETLLGIEAVEKESLEKVVLELGAA